MRCEGLMGVTVGDRILLLLSIKETGKFIDFGHIFEKVVRDEGRPIKESEIIAELDELIGEGLVKSDQNRYAITEKGFEKIVERLSLIEDNLNLSYRMVLVAKEYYGKIADYIMPFLKERPVSVVKIFSDEQDPLRKVKPLFVRYARYKPKPTFISINNREVLMRYVDDHAIDYIPYVHGFNMKEPDWLVFDLDAGEDLKSKEEGFLAIKFVAKELYNFLEENQVLPALKFSGSRGIQVWAVLDNFKIPGGDLFATYRTIIQKVQGKIEERISGAKVPLELRPLVEGGLTTSSVAKKEERSKKVLIDWSSMKPYGDVRAPFSLHYKTGLISCPIDPARVISFQPEEAKPEQVSREAEHLRQHFELVKSDPSHLLKSCSL
ncbi:MAG: non-homologous end-joining DNA ligase LigD [Candidatus Methanomethylicaceae archaeon]